jgi:hypothetical protein
MDGGVRAILIIGIVVIQDSAFLGIVPGSVHADTQVAGEEVVEPTPPPIAVIPEQLHLARAFADRICAEHVELQFTSSKAPSVLVVVLLLETFHAGKRGAHSE